MTETVTQPLQNDVLCGRGGATNNHVGNRRYRAIVADHQPKYLRAKKREKAGIARSIVDIVRSRGGRFLKKVDDGTERWIDVGDKKATEKTSQALREGLDVRREEGQGAKSPRRYISEPVSSGGAAQQPPKKRRRTKGPNTELPFTSAVFTPYISPALVSELGGILPAPFEDASLPSLGEEDFDHAQFIFEPPTPSADDATDVAAV